MTTPSGHSAHCVQAPGSRRVSGPAQAGTEASPNRRCSTRLLSASVHQVRDIDKEKTGNTHETLSTDSEATAEGAVRAAGGPAGDEEQDILQVTVKTLPCLRCHCFQSILYQKL